MDDKKKLLKIRILLTSGVLAIVLILAIVFIDFPDNSLAEFKYEIEEDGYAVVLGYTGEVKKLEIPSQIDSYTVKYIGERAFSTNESILESVSIPSSVTEIRKDAFCNLSNLRKVDFSEGLEFIGEGAFENCDFLVSASLPDSLEIIDDKAFMGCTRLGRIKIPARVERIGTDAFMGCESLILNISENELAKDVAESYNIPTTFKDSGDYTLLIALILSALSIILFIAVLTVFKKIAEKKKKANNAEERHE